MGDITREIHEIAGAIGDPVLIVLTIVILALLVFLFFETKQTNRREQKYIRVICTLAEEVHRSSRTLEKLTALMEILIHLKDKDKN